MNVHEQSWLQFSDGSSPEGRALRDVACGQGWEKRVRKPTGGDNLLDLALTDLGSDLKTKVVAGVSDHKAALGTLDVSIVGAAVSTRSVFDYAKVSWSDLRKSIGCVDWGTFFEGMSANQMASTFSQRTVAELDKHVPKKMVSTNFDAHPWINDRCRRAIGAKIAAAGSSEETIARDSCSECIVQEYDKYVQRMKRKLDELPGSSRSWWRLANGLAGKHAKSSGIQPLQAPNGEWARSPADKANLLADTFERKSKLPDTVENEYSALRAPAFSTNSFLPVRTKDVCRMLRRLKLDSSTGPDGISTRVLKACADELSYPLALMTRKIVSTGVSPLIWREHWQVPLYKRKSRANPSNYRGIHLTSQMSKATERIIGKFSQRFFEQSGAYGERQFAYSQGKSHRDALAVSVLTWLLALEKGHVVFLYCSDVSGAFDKVEAERMVAKLASLNLHPDVFAVLRSWLEPKPSSAVVEGAHSTKRTLRDSVFQSTVWGPPLWNCVYADASIAILSAGCTGIVFAEDLNCTKILPAHVSDEEISADALGCHRELHRWESADRTTFDRSKENVHVLHRFRGEGSNCTILGIENDTSLVMHDAAHGVAVEAGRRLKTVLHTRRFHKLHQTLKLYKSQIFTFIGSRIVGLHHVAPTTLQCIDKKQRRFLREIDVSQFDSDMHLRLAPLTCRRAIAMLVRFYRIANGLATRALCDMFGCDTRQRTATHNTRETSLRHAMQYKEIVVMGRRTQVFRRSFCGMVTIWNKLPPDVVFSETVKQFQSLMRSDLKTYASAHEEFDEFVSRAKQMPIRVKTVLAPPVRKSKQHHVFKF